MARVWKSFKRGRKTIWKRVETDRAFFVCESRPPFGHGRNHIVAKRVEDRDFLPASCANLQTVNARTAAEAKKKFKRDHATFGSPKGRQHRGFKRRVRRGRGN